MNREDKLKELAINLKSWGTVHPTKSYIGGWGFLGGQYVHTIHDPISIDDWNRAKIVPNTKIRIESPEHSEYVQKLAFEGGFNWLEGCVVQFKDKPYLYFLHKHSIMYEDKKHDFTISLYKEIFIEMPKALEADINARVLAEKTGSKHNAVHNPKHYEVIEGVEAIELIAASLTLEQWRGYCLGNIIKYRLRAGKKDDLQQDIDKANEYEILYSKYADTCKGV